MQDSQKFYPHSSIGVHKPLLKRPNNNALTVVSPNGHVHSENMGRWSEGERRKLREAFAAIETLSMSGPQAIEIIPALLLELMQTERTMAYTLRAHGDGLAIDQVRALGPDTSRWAVSMDR